MGTYIVVFTISTLLFAITPKIKKEQRIYIELISVFLLCFVAGMRDISVGTDTFVYFRPISEAAISSSNARDYFSFTWYPNTWSQKIVSQYELGFTLLVYIVGHLTKSIFAIQFVVQFLIIYPIYYVIKRSNDIPLWLGMLVFDLLLFNPSLNMIRQSVAMSFVFLGLFFYSKKKLKQAIISICIAVSFHSSGLIGILILFLYTFIKNGKAKGRLFRNWNLFLAIVAGCLFLIINNVVANILSSTSLWRFAGYIAGEVEFMPNQLINRLPPLLMLLYSIIKDRQNSENKEFYFAIFVYSLIFSQFTSVNSFGGRIGQYFSMFGVVSYPSTVNGYRHKVIVSLILILYLIFYWWFYYVFGNTGETMPFMWMV